MLSAEHPTEALVSVRPRVPASAARARPEGTAIALCVAVFLLVSLPLPYLLRFDHTHVVTSTLLATVLLALSFYSQQGAITATMVFLAILGDYRRYCSYFAGFPKNDPLLLVAPAVALFLLGHALFRDRTAPPTALSRLLLGLMLLMLVEVFNPVQGDLQVGLAGALIYLAPLLWFWVGRAYASAAFAEAFTFRMVIAVGTAATLLGLYQAHFGLLPFEQQWVEQVGYQALYISDEVVRAIGFFSSSAEYQRYLVIVAVTTVALWLTTRSRLIILLPFFLLAIFLSAARGPVIMVVLGAIAAWAVSARSVLSWVPRLAVATALGAVALIGLLLFLQSNSFSGRVAPLVERQVSGLLDPGNLEKSTATGHLQMIKDGLIAGVTAPAGEGLGATTFAAEKYGAKSRNAEVDFANLMISVGLLGGVLYLAIVFGVLWRALNWWRTERTRYALVMVGTLVGTLGGWLIGGEYSVAALVWFQIGLMDRLARDGEFVRRRTRLRPSRIAAHGGLP
jgi:hypothetical protein